MELKDILGFVDIGDIKTVDEFKEKFNGKFAPKADLDDVSKKLAEATGKMYGSFTTNTKRVFGLTNEEIKDKKWEEVLELGVAKLKAETDELKKNAGQGNDKALEKALAELDKAKKSLDEEREAKQSLQSVFEKTTGEFEGKLKGLKIGNKFEDAKSKVIPKLKSDMSKAEQLGFEASLASLVIDLDDKEEVVVKDKEGNRLKDPSKAGAFLSLEQALEQKATELNLIKKNTGNGGQPVSTNLFGGQQRQEVNLDTTKNPQGRTIHPNALKVTG